MKAKRTDKQRAAHLLMRRVRYRVTRGRRWTFMYTQDEVCDIVKQALKKL